jgi:hypothetical protein
MLQPNWDCSGDEMKLWDKIWEVEQNIRKRVENAFGRETSQMPLEVRREILEQVEARIAIDKGVKLFSFERLEIHLNPATMAQCDVFDMAFLANDSLKSDIRNKLHEAQAPHGERLEIFVELHKPDGPDQAGNPHRELFRLNFVKQDQSRPRETPESSMEIIKGSVEQAIYRLRKERILIGRLSEVTDLEGRMVRKNDVVFSDNGDDINSTVGRIHARIWFDHDKQEFRIMDEASRYGTRIARDGRSIEVPGGNSRGVRLKSGDEIYFGQACMRFEFRALVERNLP